MKSKVSASKRPTLTHAQRSRALGFHVRKMNELLDNYSGSVFKAWLQINALIGRKQTFQMHLSEFERLAKEAKCK